MGEGSVVLETVAPSFWEEVLLVLVLFLFMMIAEEVPSWRKTLRWVACLRIALSSWRGSLKAEEEGRLWSLSSGGGDDEEVPPPFENRFVVDSGIVVVVFDEEVEEESAAVDKFAIEGAGDFLSLLLSPAKGFEAGLNDIL